MELVAQDEATVLENSHDMCREAVTFALRVRKLFTASGKMGTFVNSFCSLFDTEFSATQPSTFSSRHLAICSWMGVFIFIRKLSVGIS